MGARMKLQALEIENFKGIQKARVEIATKAPGNVITLIGLNESGKTTVLEALSHFVSVDAETSSIVNTVAAQQRPVDLIPKSKKSNFTGEISIRAFLELDDEDVADLASHLLSTHGIILLHQDMHRTISTRRVYRFVDSDPRPAQTRWLVRVPFKKKNGSISYVAEAEGKHSEVGTQRQIS
jgi:ABC-type cobalamin/Fe3+-siderophores transport system ATPase subunit